MAKRVRRKNERWLMWLRAVAVFVVTWVGLNAMNVRPSGLSIVVAAVAAVLTLMNSELGVLVAVAALCIPLIAAQPILGLGALILGIVAIRYLGTDGGRTFLIIGISILGAIFGPVWAGVALAGYLLGAGEGALAAAVACVIIEALGIGLGKQIMGVVITGGPPAALLSFDHMPATLLSSEWLRTSFATLDAANVNRVIGGLSGITRPLALVIQPMLWAAGAATAGMVHAEALRRKSAPLDFAAVVAGALVPALGTVLAFSLAVLPVPWVALTVALVSSAVIAVAFVAVWESFFRAEQKAPTPAARRMSMSSEDADVDELLRLIATAEDKLASQHTSTKVVLITDMKSFSTMTEEDGSVATAKAIQRHRDLLIPVISANGGSGKSTGGDGLVAAFDTAASGLLAAAAMQQALAEHNAGHPSDREIWVRMGLASGEVVLDNGGRPFIGAGLNLAARVMNLADGGQVFAAGDVAAEAQSAGLTGCSFGNFELKNIAKPVEIVEILWAEEQEPHDPRAIEVAEEEE
ncbi:MAG: adenylate/guanylate cyclase domain-containing protein [Coriobacteriia bacterium]